MRLKNPWLAKMYNTSNTTHNTHKKNTKTHIYSERHYTYSINYNIFNMICIQFITLNKLFCFTSFLKLHVIFRWFKLLSPQNIRRLLQRKCSACVVFWLYYIWNKNPYILRNIISWCILHSFSKQMKLFYIKKLDIEYPLFWAQGTSEHVDV